MDGVWILAPHELSIAMEILGQIPKPRLAVGTRIGQSPTGLIGVLGKQPWFVMEVSARFVDLRREVRLYCEKGLALLPDAYADHIQIIHQPSVANPKDSQRQLRPISTEPLPSCGNSKPW